MLQLINQGNHPKVRAEGGLSFVQLENNHQVAEDVFLECQGILLQVGNEETASTLIQWVRTHQQAQIALKPLFIPEVLKGKVDNEIHTDGYYDNINFKQLVIKSQQINKRLDEISWKSNSIDVYQTETTIRLLRYLYSREQKVQPILSRRSKIGYEYSFLSTYWSNKEAHKSLAIIDHARQEGILKGNIRDKIHLCHECHSNYLNYRECCGNCSSIDLITENIIHHFVCAHVAPESEFRKGDELVCPKCDKTLRHIGIDYDKPSVIHHCNHCDHESQQTDMKAKCIDCHTESSLEELLEYSIYDLELTSAGIHRAIKGLESKTEAIDNQQFDLNVFKLLLKQEGARVERSKGNSVFGKFVLNDPKLQNLSPQMSQMLQIEVLEVLQQHLYSPEILIQENAYSFAFLLPDYNDEEALNKVSSMREHLIQLLQDNLPVKEDNIQFKLRMVDRFSNLNQLNIERTST